MNKKILLVTLTLLVVVVMATPMVAGGSSTVIGPRTPPDWHDEAQVQLGWVFDDPTNPQDSDPLPEWNKAIGDIPVWDYDPDRIVWDQPGQWYIRITNLNNDKPVKNFWISWVYEFDTYLPGLRSATSFEWFPDSGYGNFQYIEEWFDSDGNPTTDFLVAAYARVTLSADLYPNPEYEDIWLGVHGGVKMAVEVYVLTLCGAEADLRGRSAWPEHHHFVLSKDGDPTVDDKHLSPGLQTLYGQVGNTGTATLPAGTYKVVWEVNDSDGNLVGIYETAGDEALAPGEIADPLTYDLDVSADSFGPGKYYVTARCWFYGVPGDKIKEFSFSVVP